MSVVRAIFKNFLAFLLSAVLTTIPYKGILLPVIDTLEDDCLLNVEMLSDIHLEEKELLRSAFLKLGLKNCQNAKAKIDAVVVSGDLTNYADEPSLAKYYDIISEYSPAPVITAAGNHDIGHAGDRDVTDISREEAMANFIRYQNAYAKTDNQSNYYSQTVNGYKFIVMGDEVLDGGHWDAISITQEQLDFLDRELADGTKDGLPVFVVSHWPLYDVNGEQTIWPDSGVDPNEYDIAAILEKYKNVFYISGHMHSGIKADVMDELYGLSNAEQVNGVTYLNLPTFGIVNMFGSPWPGSGAQLEVYSDKVIFRPRNFLTGKWFVNSAFTFDLVD